MMFDLMIKGVSLTDDIGEFDVACKDGKIVEIAKSILTIFPSLQATSNSPMSSVRLTPFIIKSNII
jgi:hypothetical protein